MIRLYPRFAALALAAAFAVSGATLAATGAPAAAAEMVVTAQPTARVAYEDLDLRSPAGAARLDARVRAAAEKLCFGTGTVTLQARLEGFACRDAAIASAAPQVRRLLSGATQGAAPAIGLGR
ncbi:MAG: UrcA family protein [Alphaproteobacteria bacterium]|nr:UrcA family protein [Alphaproteobacteria bacterium]MBV9370724.1 UrcA family protein [Alphaproteobacteria bacterium]MBV9899797.1 UrcA family protein [Alphaproteobacteria bacterium]